MNTLHELLAECDALRTRLSSLRPLPIDALKKIEEALNIEYTYESNRIEGNTLTLQETELVVNEGVTIAGKSMREHLEAINHAEAIDYIKDFARSSMEINERTIKEIHSLVLHGIDRENAGRYRTIPVMISGSRHTSPYMTAQQEAKKCPELFVARLYYELTRMHTTGSRYMSPYMIAPQMEAFIIRLREMEEAKEHPVVIAAYLHDELVRIHPFIDGNERTARLLMNLYLLRNGFALVSLKGDNEDKIRYYKSLETSHVDKQPEAFQQLVAEAEIASLQRYLSIIGEY